MRNIDLIRQVISASENNWPHVLGCLNINVPDSPRRHAPCPACGGKDRFRFDDNGRGSFICNQCGAGDGLDLIKRVNNCDTTEAALLAADVLGIDYRTTETPEATSQKREQLETERQRREQERLKRAEKDEQQRRDTFSRQFDDMRRKAVNGKSDYLVAKGVGDFTFPVTGIGAALAAPLIGLVGADGFGIHFYEQSSAGKTTTANVASSLYGNPDLLRLTWYGTALGLANEAAAHNDGLMPLDEVGQGADPVSVSQSAYALFNGVGKLQGAKDGGNRDLKRWRTVAISTGEMDLETFIATSGRKTKAGQLVRLLNIPLSKAVRFHDYQNGKQHADALKDAYQHHHGAAGREWIKWLADHQQQAIKTVRDCESRWRNLIPSDYGEQVHRVAARFAILEAALLLGEVVTGWDAQTCRDAIQHSYNAWLREFGTGNKEHQQIIEQTEAFLNAYGLSRFAPFPYSPADLPIKDLAGYRQRGEHDESPMIFYTFPATFEKEIACGFNAKQFAEVLKKAGMLTPPNSGRGYQRKSPRIQGRQINVYVLNYQPGDYNSSEE
ncbi:DUF927 domain-containing protein [Escherichia coli]|nr:DUF927 domain-containing protein [Escherichia coli]